MARQLAVNPAPRNPPAADIGGSLSTDLVWGIAAIADEIGRNFRQTVHLLENRRLPAQKIGGRWCSSRSALKDFFASKFSTEAA